jgi:hypothetical protein
MDRGRRQLSGPLPHPRLAASLSLALLCCIAPAAAQTSRPAPQKARPAAAPGNPRGSISVNGGYQLTSTQFDDSFTFTVHQETGTSRLTYPIDAGPTFDVGGGMQIWRGLGIGVAISRFTLDGSVMAESSIPHPFFLQQHRSISGEANGSSRQETAVHVQAQYSIPAGRRLQITLMAGPSVLSVTQALVLDVNFAEEYPFDTATFGGVDSADRTGTDAGFNAGADVRWMFTRSVGVGAVLRFTRATVDLAAGDGRTVAVDAGGTQAGVGLRLAF